MAVSKKRRMFDIDMPEETGAQPETFPAGKVEDRSNRRGPMAVAIAETAESTRERQSLEASIRAENDALAHEHARLIRLGLVVDLVPLDAIETHMLVRDRAKGPDGELDTLKTSIREIGLSNPIRVEARPDGKFELIQGYRRMMAYRALHEETGEALYATIPAAINPSGDSVDSLYRKMVDENLVRKDISFAEMAQLALDYAADPLTQENDPDKAVALLFRSAGYQKRSYIRSFIKLVSRLGKHLQFAPDIPRALGMALVARMEEVEGLVPMIAKELKAFTNRSVQDELALLRRYAGTPVDDLMDPPAGKPAPLPTPPRKATGGARTSFQFDRREGRGKCIAAAGKLEIRLGRDFTTIDRRRLEQAVKLMLDQLD
ncbi:replication protein [Seohaeicola zhoushanensis]|uniref:Replication protein n=1 Tax=Seohaeicola zhoushanensis TaxID=1569283 RepID=A0A8J3H1Z8_9RHOB|nr:replication protein [Seohaeicola zhoushanensis]